MKFPTSSKLVKLLCAVSLPVCAVACNAEESAEYNTGTQGLEIPDDEDLKWAAEQPWGGVQFVDSCKSISANGSETTTAPLPVGDGAHIECNKWSNALRNTMSVMSENHGAWCVLGEAIEFKPGGDSRLSITVSRPPSASGFALTAVPAPGQPAFGVEQAEAFGALTWPLWLNVTYRTVDMRPEANGQSCEQVFGL